MRPQNRRWMFAAEQSAGAILFIVASGGGLADTARAQSNPEKPAATSADADQPAASNEADTKISNLVMQIRGALETGHLTSPDQSSAAEFLADALALAPLASSQGESTIRNLPGVLKQQAQQEYTQGHWQAGANFEAFAEVLSSMAAAQDGAPHPERVSAGTANAVQPGPTGNEPTAAVPPTIKSAVVVPVVNRLPSANPPPASVPAIGTTPASPPVQSSPPAREPAVEQLATIKPPAAVTPPPEVSSPKPPVLQPAFVGALIQRGDALIALGDISGARRLYTLAAQNNSADAAVKLGDTYTPDFLAQHGVEGLQPDMTQARAWYQKAAALGDAAAQKRMAALVRLQ